jgi:hypothetical protein
VIDQAAQTQQRHRRRDFTYCGEFAEFILNNRIHLDHDNTLMVAGMKVPDSLEWLEKEITF